MESRTGPRRGLHAATSFGTAIGIGAALSLVVGIIVLAFAWPSVTAEPKDLPVAVAGPDASVDQLESRVADQAGGAIALERVDDRDAAVAAIERRDAYGAIVLGDAPTDAPEVLVASAASPVVAQTLRAMAAELQQGIDAQLRAAPDAAAVGTAGRDPLRGRGRARAGRRPGAGHATRRTEPARASLGHGDRHRRRAAGRHRPARHGAHGRDVPARDRRHARRHRDLAPGHRRDAPGRRGARPTRSRRDSCSPASCRAGSARCRATTG